MVVVVSPQTARHRFKGFNPRALCPSERVNPDTNKMIGHTIQVGLLLLLAALVAGHVDALSQEQNLAYIEKVLDYLNNNRRCTLPTFFEADRLQSCFQELELEWGPAFESRLTEDQRLVRETLLLKWDLFQRLMSSAVVIRSAKKRSFLCRVEDYQVSKFGYSVCTRYKDIRGPITDHIFEKDPVVRYIKHLETGELIEFPAGTGKNLTSFLASGALPRPDEVTGVGGGEPGQLASPEPNGRNTNEPGSGMMEPAKESREEEEIRHTYIGNFTNDPLGMSDGNLTIDFKRLDNDDDDNDRDPLEDITVPSSDDRTTYETSDGHQIRQEQTDEELLPAFPAFDQFGADHIDEELDDTDLDRLVRVPKRDWQFDPVYGYFKWPDECNSQLCPANQPLDDSMLLSDGAWFRFLRDPNAYEASIQPTTTPRPLINAARLRKEQSLFEQSALDESRQGQVFGWNNERTPKKIEQYMGEIKRDRWKNLTDNNFIKVSYNKDYLKNKSKSGYKAVKKFFGGLQLEKRKARLKVHFSKE